MASAFMVNNDMNNGHIVPPCMNICKIEQRRCGVIYKKYPCTLSNI